MRLEETEAFQNYAQPKKAFTEDGREIIHFANICHVCHNFGEKTNLKRCGDCNMISYCNAEHQKKDWPSHRNFCKAIVHVKKSWNLTDVFEPLKYVSKRSNIKIGEPHVDLEPLLGNVDEPTYRANFKGILTELLPQILERPIHSYERDMIYHPRVCASCFECKSELLTNCKKCPQTSFCKEHLNDTNHEEVCPKMLICFLSLTKKERMQQLNEVRKQLTVPVQQKAVNLSSTMANFLDTYLLNSSIVKYKEAFEADLMHAICSDRLSRSLTLIFGMEKFNLTSRSRITVHIIGANMQELVYEDWEPILHLLPQLSELELVFIGPSVILGYPGVENVKKVCKLCKKKRKKLIIKIEKSMYQNYFCKADFRKPDIIAGFNAGLHAYSSWDEGLEILGKLNCPLVLTEAKRGEGQSDREEIASKFPSANCVFFDLNPYASSNYGRDHSTEAVLSRNGFLLLYEDFGTAAEHKVDT